MNNVSASIIIPAYNAGKFIAETIHSVINQTYNNWELIIIDDGATDNTKNVVALFLSDNRIKYFYQKNAGVSAARNKGLEMVTGDYIAFLDADDVWEPENIEKKIKMLVDFPDVDWVYSDMFEAGEKMNKVKVAAIGRDDNILENILLWEGEVVPGPCSNLVVRRKCITNGVKFDTHLSTAADQDFCLQLAKSYKGKRIGEALWSYRILSTSMSRNIKTMQKDHIYVYRKARKDNMFQSFWFQQKCFSNLFIILAGSWWVWGQNKWRGIFFLFLSILYFPPNIKKIAKKLIK